MAPAKATTISAVGEIENAENNFQGHFNKKRKLEIMLTPCTFSVKKMMEGILHKNMTEEQK